jgi:hypothetical protein
MASVRGILNIQSLNEPTLHVRELKFQGPHSQTHTHKPRKGVRGRRSHSNYHTDTLYTR